MAHVWRKMKAAPYLQYACTIEPAPETSDGFKITDVDSDVVSPDWLHDLTVHMTEPVLVPDAMTRDGITDFTIRESHSKEHGHFDAAVRSIPNAVLSSVGRS